ncbi:hypothetical protein C8Q76DRAFT_692462 [Earliella scabrosa]|nr:hypothetical protein C8Q76DRAFT_692462 [Earliella scabrosa]
MPLRNETTLQSTSSPFWHFPRGEEHAPQHLWQENHSDVTINITPASAATSTYTAPLPMPSMNCNPSECHLSHSVYQRAGQDSSRSQLLGDAYAPAPTWPSAPGLDLPQSPRPEHRSVSNLHTNSAADWPPESEDRSIRGRYEVAIEALRHHFMTMPTTFYGHSAVFTIVPATRTTGEVSFWLVPAGGYSGRQDGSRVYSADQARSDHNPAAPSASAYPAEREVPRAGSHSTRPPSADPVISGAYPDVFIGTATSCDGPAEPAAHAGLNAQQAYASFATESEVDHGHDNALVTSVGSTVFGTTACSNSNASPVASFSPYSSTVYEVEVPHVVTYAAPSSPSLPYSYILDTPAPPASSAFPASTATVEPSVSGVMSPSLLDLELLYPESDEEYDLLICNANVTTVVETSATGIPLHAPYPGHSAVQQGTTVYESSIASDLAIDTHMQSGSFSQPADAISAPGTSETLDVPAVAPRVSEVIGATSMILRGRASISSDLAVEQGNCALGETSTPTATDVPVLRRSQRLRQRQIAMALEAGRTQSLNPTFICSGGVCTCIWGRHTSTATDKPVP